MIHVAVDIGASSGRVVLGNINNNKLNLQELHRFTNGFSKRNGTLYWDVDHLLHEILIGLEKVKQTGYSECTLGIDTWAVDYVLLNREGKRLKDVISYRDRRTENTIEKVTKKMTREEIYELTGIQFLPFNTIYQLYEEDKHVLEKTERILLIPDYLNYCLTGRMCMETTNASTTQLLDINNHDFSNHLLEIIGLNKDKFAPLTTPGNKLGYLDKNLFPEFDLPNCQVINVASHDTASAIVGTPSLGGNWAYISSGTWSLLGIESQEPIISPRGLKANYTNEWGAYGTYRFLKNIMGMWIIQEVRRNLTDPYEYSELVALAEKVDPFEQYIDLNDNRFLNPSHMIEEIQKYCQETNQKVPTSPGELAAAVYYNLAIIYAIELAELESITNQNIDELYIVGGGGQNKLLNQLTANVSQKKVLIGPSEATSIGNILVQLITTDEISDLQEGRQMIAESFGFTEYVPQEVQRDKMIEKFNRVTQQA